MIRALRRLPPRIHTPRKTAGRPLLRQRTRIECAAKWSRLDLDPLLVKTQAFEAVDGTGGIIMSSARLRTAALGVAAVVVWTGLHVVTGRGAAPVMAQDKGGGSSAVGTFKTNTQPAAPEPAHQAVTLDPKQLEAVKQVNAYFNQFQTLKGTFLQTDPEKKRLRGKLYVKRPGKLRFEYNLPSRQLIVSDGEQVAIQDLDLKTDDRVPLDQTPFRMLLKKDVDILRDARISEVQDAEDLVILTIQDRSPDAPGRIRLFMSKLPQMELKEWVTTDAQGKDTRVELVNLTKSEEIDQALFKIVNPGFRQPNQ